MTAAATFEVKGLKELDKQLSNVGESFRWKSIRKGMKASMLPVQTQAVAGYASISRNLGLQLKMYSSTKYQSVQVGWKWPKNLTETRIQNYLKSATRPAYYARFVEKGFEHRGGRTVAGKRILANAFDSQETQILSRFVKSLDTTVEKAVKKR